MVTLTSPQRRRDPAQTRRRILEAAAAELAERGFAGARVDRIAAAARINKRMLYHYFGDKRALRQAVLDDRLGGGGADRVLDGRADRASIRLVLWALLEDPSALAQHTRLEASPGDLLGVLVRVLAPAPEAGREAGRKPRIRLKPRGP